MIVLHVLGDYLAQMAFAEWDPVPFRMWFEYGYCALRFTDTGEPKPDLTGVDRRCDPRCTP